MLFMISFLESFISPILPDVLLIPLAIANPEKAIWFAGICIVGNILGGYVGYGIGYKMGPPAMRKWIPETYQIRLKDLALRRGAWAVFIASILPIPFKIVAVFAGVVRLPIGLFTLAAILGRTKRFLPIGIILYYFGPELLFIWEAYTPEILWTLLVLFVLGVFIYWMRK